MMSKAALADNSSATNPLMQGLTCKPNTHQPGFQVGTAGLGRSSQRSNAGRYPWDMGAEMMEDEDDEFELWLQEALDSGFFSETSSKRRWSPFRLPNKKGKKYGRRSL